MLDKESFIKYLDAHAEPHSTGYCARHIRLALEAAGAKDTDHPEDAKNYGPFLKKLGATEVSEAIYKPLRTCLKTKHFVATTDARRQ
jgi:hypothetical protein